MKRSITESEKSLLRELARLDISSKMAITIWVLLEESPNAMEMTTEILKTMESADWHEAFEAMTKALTTYPTPEMNRLKMES